MTALQAEAADPRVVARQRDQVDGSAKTAERVGAEWLKAAKYSMVSAKLSR